jgi:PAS domain-containing protein
VATRTKRQKSLALIRAREVATSLSLPIAVLDADGDIVFYNEAAETILGDTFEAAGELSSEQWAAAFCPEREDGTPIPLHEPPRKSLLHEYRRSSPQRRLDRLSARGPRGAAVRRVHDLLAHLMRPSA